MRKMWYYLNSLTTMMTNCPIAFLNFTSLPRTPVRKSVLCNFKQCQVVLHYLSEAEQMTFKVMKIKDESETFRLKRALQEHHCSILSY